MRPLQQPVSAPRLLNVLGTTVQTLVAGAQTGGSLAICLLSSARAGDRVPPHIHHEQDETFHVLEGKMRVLVGGVETILSAGMTGFGPRGVVHTWETLEPSRFLVSVTPSGLEEMFIEMDRIDATPPDMQAISAICRRYGIEFV